MRAYMLSLCLLLASCASKSDYSDDRFSIRSADLSRVEYQCPDTSFSKWCNLPPLRGKR